MEQGRALRTALCLLAGLALLGLPAHGRSVSAHGGLQVLGKTTPESEQHTRHHRARHADEAQLHTQRVEYQVGKPEFPVKIGVGPAEDAARPVEGLPSPPTQWRVVSGAARADAGLVQLAARDIIRHVDKAVQQVAETLGDHKPPRDLSQGLDSTDDKDDSDDDDDDDDNDGDLDDDDDVSEWDDDEDDSDADLQNPYDQVELGQEGDAWKKGHIEGTQLARRRPPIGEEEEDLPVVSPDVYAQDEILRIEGTPAPALITGDSAEGGTDGDAVGVAAGDTTPPALLFDADLMAGDAAAAERRLRAGGARAMKAFKPVRMPIHFESYDVAPADGVISLQELVNITGARVNVHRAFNASDANGDGFLDQNEFYAAPWKLGPNWRHEPVQAVDFSKEGEEEDDDDDDYDDDDYDDDDYDEDEDEWDTWDDDPEFWDDVEDADIF